MFMLGLNTKISSSECCSIGIKRTYLKQTIKWSRKIDNQVSVKLPMTQNPYYE